MQPSRKIPPIIASNTSARIQSLFSNFSLAIKPLSKYIAPIKASRLSAITLFSILIFLFLGLNICIYFSNSIFLAISRHFFLLTRDANFLSNITSFSFG